jgi:hypothetical protein
MLLLPLRSWVRMTQRQALQELLLLLPLPQPPLLTLTSCCCLMFAYLTLLTLVGWVQADASASLIAPQ